ncbi:hypothetical protein F5X96DRAFT_671465 [Biscogniauxia mediterranea]|nr:hypothetical protein F5X96DRAFT_671465 [Biscogniauxia mediterranea]
MNKPYDHSASSAGTPPAPPPAPRRTTKIIIGTISAVLAAALLALGVLGFSAPIGFRILGGLATALSAAILLYHLLESSLVLTTRAPCLSPAWALSLNLVLGLAGAVVAALLISSTAYVVARWEGSFDDDFGDSSSSSTTPVPGYVADGYRWFRLSVAACALAVAEAIIHLVLATLAAIDVHRLRLHRSAARPAAAEADEAAPAPASPRAGSSNSSSTAHELESGKSGAGTYSPEPKSRGI